MAENTEGLADQVKAAGKEAAELAPIVEVVGKIAEHVEKSEKRQNERTEEIGTKAERRADDLEEKVEKGFEDMAGRLDKLKDRSSILNTLHFEDTTAPLKAVADDRTKALAQRMPVVNEYYRRRLGEKSVLTDPLVAASTMRWFQESAKLGVKSYQARAHEIAPQFEKLDKAFKDMVTKADLQEGTTTEGGHLVPTIVEPEIIRLILDNSDIFPRLRQIPMTSWKHDVPDTTTAVTINWIAEEGTLTGGEPVFGKKTLQANKIAGRARMSRELVDDSNVSVLSYLLEAFAEKIGNELDFQTMEGTTPFTGVNTAASVNEVEATASTAGADLTYPLITQIFVKARQKSTRRNAIFVMSDKIFGKLIGLVDSNGQPIVKGIGMLDSAPDGTLLGRPIVVSSALGSFTVGSDSTGHIYFGPPAGLLAGTRMGLRWEVTDQVGWATDQLDARLIGRFAYIVGLNTAWTKGTKFHDD